MRRGHPFRLAASLIVLAALAAAILSSNNAASAQVPPVANSPAAPGGLFPPSPTRGSVINNTAPPRPSSNVPLSNGELRDDVDNFVHNRTLVPDLGVQNQFTRVEVIHNLPASQMRDAIAALGGTIEGEAENIVQASVPVDQLVALEQEPGVQFIRPPLRIDIPVSDDMPNTGASSPSVDRAPLTSVVVGEEIAKTNAAAWQAAGITGAGVKVGIVDYFSQAIWTSAQTAGEVPAPAGTFCQNNGGACNVFTVYGSGQQHGTAVAEIIHEMAPGAQIYLASAVTTVDLQAAVNYFASQGVKIISRSSTSAYDGPGNGTGPIANVVNSAVAQGMAWFNAAGNTASDGSVYGQYWRGSWSDPNANGWLNFPGGGEFLGVYCGFMNGLRWSDWGANATDYDVFVYDSPNGNLIGTSWNNQGAGAPPIENIPCPNAGWEYVSIALFSSGSGTAGDVLEIMTNQGALTSWQNPYSASGPVADSNSPGEVTVGAIDPALGTTIAPYSSQGPTNDNRIKPDLSAAACVASFTYAPNCFNGTSAATPATAGAAALVLSAGLASTPAQLRTYLLNNATIDRGAAGTDNVYGRGELILPTPPPVNDNFAKAIVVSSLPFLDARTTNGAGIEPGEVTPSCTPVLTGGVSQTVWYKFTPSVTALYQVDTLTSNFDTVIGVYTGGLGTASIACNDDVSASIQQSQVPLLATAGTTYWIQVGSYGISASGSLVLHVSAAAPPTPTPTATWTNTPTASATWTNTPTPTATWTNTSTPTATPTNTPTPTATPTNTPPDRHVDQHATSTLRRPIRQPTSTSTNTPTPTTRQHADRHTPTATANTAVRGPTPRRRQPRGLTRRQPPLHGPTRRRRRRRGPTPRRQRLHGPTRRRRRPRGRTRRHRHLR